MSAGGEGVGRENGRALSAGGEEAGREKGRGLAAGGEEAGREKGKALSAGGTGAGCEKGRGLAAGGEEAGREKGKALSAGGTGAGREKGKALAAGGTGAGREKGRAASSGGNGAVPEKGKALSAPSAPTVPMAVILHLRAVRRWRTRAPRPRARWTRLDGTAAHPGPGEASCRGASRARGAVDGRSRPGMGSGDGTAGSSDGEGTAGGNGEGTAGGNGEGTAGGNGEGCTTPGSGAAEFSLAQGDRAAPSSLTTAAGGGVAPSRGAPCSGAMRAAGATGIGPSSFLRAPRAFSSARRFCAATSSRYRRLDRSCPRAACAASLDIHRSRSASHAAAESPASASTSSRGRPASRASGHGGELLEPDRSDLLVALHHVHEHTPSSPPAGALRRPGRCRLAAVPVTSSPAETAP